MKRGWKTGMVMVAAIAMSVSGIGSGGSGEPSTAKADRVTNITAGEAVVQKEITTKRDRFMKQYALSDGSFLANSYSMPIHYKKNGKWKEIDTTFVKTKDGKKYRTKSTSLSIQVAKKANKKEEVFLARGNSKLSIALQGDVAKNKKVTIKNPKKSQITDILNENLIQYKKAYTNQTLSYEIYPEKVVEKIGVKKKSAAKKITLRLNTKLKIKVKNNRVYCKTKAGKTRYTRLKTIITDGKGVSTSKVKVVYHKESKTLTLTPDKKWLNSKKRTFPMTVRTAYITNQHERDVRIGAAYAGSPKANYTYDESLLLQANKCMAFTQMSNLAELGKPNVYVRNARLYVKNEKTLSMGAGKTFDIGIHRVTTQWTGKKVTNNKRPSYEPEKKATIAMQRKGLYSCDVTDVVKSWYSGVSNYGIAMVADNTNGTYQAKLGKIHISPFTMKW